MIQASLCCILGDLQNICQRLSMFLQTLSQIGTVDLNRNAEDVSILEVKRWTTLRPSERVGPPQIPVRSALSVDQCRKRKWTEGGDQKQRRERPLPSLFHDAEDLDAPGSWAKLKQPASHWFQRWQGPYITPQPGREGKRPERQRRRARNREAKNTYGERKW